MGYNACYYIFVNQIVMADIKHMESVEHKQRAGSWPFIHFSRLNLHSTYLKRLMEMAQAKVLWLIADLLGFPATILGIIYNIDNIKGLILFILAAAYLSVRLYFFIIQKKQAIREKEYELWNKEMDKSERLKNLMNNI